MARCAQFSRYELAGPITLECDLDRVEIAEWIEGRKLPPSHGTRTMPIWGERLSSEFERYTEGDELIGATLDPVMAYLEVLQRRD